MFLRFEPTKSTKGASKMRRDLINAEISNLRDLLPLPPSTRQRLSQLQLMALVCVYVRKMNYFQQVFKSHDFSYQYQEQPTPTPNIGFSKAMNGFMMMMTQNGKLLYISENAAEYLGHSMEDLLIHGDSVYDIIDRQDHQTVQMELNRADNTETDNEPKNRHFFCRMNVSRNARRQMRFGDQKVVLVRGHYVSYLPLCSRNEPVFLAACTPLAMPETRECVVHGATNVFTTVHAVDMKILHIDANSEWHLGWERSSLHGVSWYHLLHPDCCKEAQSKHRLITQSEQERSCIALLRLQRRCGQFLWVHAVLQLKDNLENSQRPVIVCTNQVLSEQEAAVMKANPWLYHYYAVQSKLHYGLAYEAASRMYGPPPGPDVQVYPPTMQYTTPPVCINGNQPVMMPNPVQPHIPHVPPHIAPMHYAYERTDNGPVDYSVSLQENRYHNIRIEDTRIQPNAKRKAKNSDEKPITPVPNMSPRCTPSTVTSGDTLVAVQAGSITSRRPGSKNFNITETEMVDQWNPSPTWSESALQKVPDVCHQDLSPYVTTTPPTPSGTPSAYTHNCSHTFVFDWSPEQYVPHTNNRCNTVTTESSYQQTWNRSQRAYAAGDSSVDENCNPNRLSLPMRVSNPPPAYNANREADNILRRQIDRPHPDSPDAKKPAL
ncbi:neuronal PAS domain-containing protein 4B-like [Ostrinia furnacalis]|uniref:neuronal PAS domain-containing protein 4B-like n=1 Tax=Ostrinia furnacalis TaxID=93504 RepID=UPI00103DB8F1|nr:neuronal PAS domain-containing protein 4B-like [Ostrinia furnacalis]